MRTWKIAALAVVGLMLVAPLAMACHTPPPPEKEGDIYAGQTILVGNYEVWIDGDYATIMFWIDEGWCLVENHIAVATDMSDYTNGKGNPQIGKFPFEATWDAGEEAYVVTVDITADPVNWVSGPLYIAIHVVVKECSGYESQTGWGEGDFTWGSRWGWYFDP